MADHGADATLLRKAARIAGLMLLLSLMVPTLNWVFVLSRFIVPRNEIETAHNVLANEFLFRVGVVGDLITSAVAVMLALALYVVLQSVGKTFALLALLLKLMEAVFWAVIALGHLAASLTLKGIASSRAIESEQIRALVGLLLNEQVTMNAIPGVFLGLNSMVFLYLLVRSKYVPGMLAGFGVLSYALIFLSNLLAIALPNYATVGSQIAWGAPSVLSELAIGSWLLIKGISVQSQDNPT